MAGFTNRPLPADTTLNGVAVFHGDQRAGTVWHSNFWGWQWTHWLYPGWVGGQCGRKDEGISNLTNQLHRGEDQ